MQSLALPKTNNNLFHCTSRFFPPDIPNWASSLWSSSVKLPWLALEGCWFIRIIWHPLWSECKLRGTKLLQTSLFLSSETYPQHVLLSHVGCSKVLGMAVGSLLLAWHKAAPCRTPSCGSEGSEMFLLLPGSLGGSWPLSPSAQLAISMNKSELRANSQEQNLIFVC